MFERKNTFDFDDNWHNDCNDSYKSKIIKRCYWFKITITTDSYSVWTGYLLRLQLFLFDLTCLNSTLANDLLYVTTSSIGPISKIPRNT